MSANTPSDAAPAHVPIPIAAGSSVAPSANLAEIPSPHISVSAAPRLRVRALEVVARHSRQPTEEEVVRRLDHYRSHNKGKEGAEELSPEAQAAAEAEDAELQQWLHQPIITLKPASDLRTKSHVLQRQIAPLLQAKTLQEAEVAAEKVEENLSLLGSFSALHKPEVALSMQNFRPVVKGNEVHYLEASQVEHPTLLERMARQVKKGVNKVVGVVPLKRAAAVAPADDDEEETNEPWVAPGAPFLPDAGLNTATDMKATIVLPPEKRIVGGQIGISTTDMGQVTTGFNLVFNNPLGRGERLTVDLSQGLNQIDLVDRHRNSFVFGWSQPDLLTRGSRSTMQAFLQHQHMPFASVTESTKGATANWVSRSQRHQLKYELSFRELQAVSEKVAIKAPALAAAVPSAASQFREPSPSILSMVNGGVGQGQSLKSALSYHYKYFSPRLDSRVVPTQGWMFLANTEYAGVGNVGDARFLKLEADAKAYVPIIPQRVSLGFSVLGSYVHNLSATQPRVFLTDRYFLGHALTMRGFEPAVCGPHDGLDALGGEFSLAGTASLGFTMPKQLRQYGIRGNVFWNAGNMLGISSHAVQGADKSAASALASSPASVTPLTHPRNSSLSSLARSFLSSARHSVGVGIAFPVNQDVRMEFNLVRPLSKHPQDQVKPWPIEFGIAMQWA